MNVWRCEATISTKTSRKLKLAQCQREAGNLHDIYQAAISTIIGHVAYRIKYRPLAHCFSDVEERSGAYPGFQRGVSNFVRYSEYERRGGGGGGAYRDTCDVEHDTEMCLGLHLYICDQACCLHLCMYLYIVLIITLNTRIISCISNYCQ